MVPIMDMQTINKKYQDLSDAETEFVTEKLYVNLSEFLSAHEKLSHMKMTKGNLSKSTQEIRPKRQTIAWCK